tara:strand:- start:27740 stop:28114 length:375 start_codon:yes stop_codon:yes gene_type:complete
MSDQKFIQQHVAPVIQNYDPNMTLSGRKAQQQVELVFQVWDYTAKFTVPVGGNCTGLSIMDSAIGTIYEDLPGLPYDEETPMLILYNAAGEPMECADDEDRDEDWLKDMLVSARILSIEPDGMI